MGSDSMSRETRKYRALENFTNLFWTCTSKMYGRSPLLVNVVAAVFLLQLSAFTTTVESASARGEVILALKRIAVIEFSGSNVAQNSLLNHTQIAAYDFEQHLVNYHERRQLQVTGLFTNKPLAVRSDRIDPTNKFRRYRDGYDVTSKNYWGSVVFTGVYGYGVAAAWLLLGLALALLACFRRCSRRPRSNKHHPSNYYLVPKLVVLLLSFIAIACIATLFALNHQTFSQTDKVKSTVLRAAIVATDTIHTVTSTLGRVQDVLEKYNIPGWKALNSTEAKLNTQADLVVDKINNNLRKFNRLIDAVKISLILVLSLSLVLVIGGLLAAFLGWSRIFFVFIMLGWILTACVWVMFGLLFASKNVASDTCLALNEFLQAPANTTLDEFLPCVDAETSNAALISVRENVGDVIELANSTVVTIQRASNFFGRGNGELLTLCNPIGGPPDYLYSETCPEGTLPISQLPAVLAPYVCMENMSNFDCFTDGRWVSSENNSTLYELSQGADDLLGTIPMLSRLANCSIVFDTFNNFVNQRCRPLNRALRSMWISILLLSIFFTLLTALWAVTNYRNKHQRHMNKVEQYMATKGRPI
ncbi:uncharacterized protein [Physcomitrium patens]|uniref:Uncharacterized protein n=1 Tax=Physcomitrium patens TaxID=3218 RepID=A0A2K1KBG2_PHYPA|nr:uncharacterized protein LOC112284750 [Physcomitrium patens]PNR51109.1 hypothetical protein PHYPA_010295 [Physcomitrium patens]|eukprot:XP_024380685.1 uncharacterized protein LOC112284750 [Physcomitrella patens]